MTRWAAFTDDELACIDGALAHTTSPAPQGAYDVLGSLLSLEVHAEQLRRHLAQPDNGTEAAILGRWWAVSSNGTSMTLYHSDVGPTQPVLVDVPMATSDLRTELRAWIDTHGDDEERKITDRKDA